MKRKMFLEFKYDGGPWELYDSTTVSAWAAEQFQRMSRDHPAATHRQRLEDRKKK